MSDLTAGDLGLYAHLMNEHLDSDGWSPIPVDVVAVGMLRSRREVAESVDHLVAHGSLERKTVDLVHNGEVIDTGFTIYRLA